jgi:iron complex outermembrane receptor protein
VDADGEQASAFFSTLEWRGLRLAGKWNQRMKRFPTGAFGTTFGDRRNRTYDGHDFVELSGTRRVSATADFSGRAYWDGHRYHGYYVYGPDSAAVLNFDRSDADLFGAEARLDWAPTARLVLTLGAEAQDMPSIRGQNYDQDPLAVYLDQEVSNSHTALFAQGEQRIGPRLRGTVGARLDHYPDVETVVSPRLDLVGDLGAGTTAKLLFGSAFRAPNTYETSFSGYGYLANPALEPERLRSVEAELERRGGAFTASLSAYRYWIRDLIDLVTVDTLGTSQYWNHSRVNARGVEAELAYVGARGLRARGALALQESRVQEPEAELSNSPRWNGFVSVTRAPVGEPLSLALGVRYLSPRRTLAGSLVDRALVADARVALRLGARAEIGLEARNLFDDRYDDPGSQEHLGDRLAQDGRTVLLTLAGWPLTRP